ncbi:MAG: SapC family protein [Sphingomonadaceae bacterium]
MAKKTPEKKQKSEDAPAGGQKLPLFYQALEPLSTQKHGELKFQKANKAPWFAKAHAVPVTIDEFISAQRDYPIVFSVGDKPVPLALLGLNENVNVYADEEGKLLDRGTYLPAYLRRYPFMLARLSRESDQMSLCFDPTSDLVGEQGEGEKLFEDGDPTETTKQVLKFCEEFEMSAQRTAAFVEEVVKADLLIDGELSIQLSKQDQPFVYRGFKMVSEEKLRELGRDKLERLSQNGALPLIFAHLFSLSLVQNIFIKQIEQNKMPEGAMPSTKLDTGKMAETEA